MSSGKTREVFDWMARNSMFVFTSIGVIVMSVLVLWKGPDMANHLLTLLGISGGHSLGTKASAHMAASRDPQVDSGALIRQMEGLPPQDSDDDNDEEVELLESAMKPDSPD